MSGAGFGRSRQRRGLTNPLDLREVNLYDVPKLLISRPKLARELLSKGKVETVVGLPEAKGLSQFDGSRSEGRVESPKNHQSSQVPQIVLRVGKSNLMIP
jgi:hypothetical protein